MELPDVNNAARFVLNKDIKITHVLSLIVAFVFSLKFLQSTPFEKIFFQMQAGFLCFVLVFLWFYFYQYVIKRKHINKIILYLLLVIFIVPFYSAFRSFSDFGQPLIYGVLSERGWVTLGIGIWLYYNLGLKKKSYKSTELSFVFMAWISLFIFTATAIIYDPSSLSDFSNSTQYVYHTEDRGIRFKFQNYFITFGSLYYFIRNAVKPNIKDFFMLMLFLLYVILIIQGRMYTIAMVISFFIFYWFNFSKSKFTIISIKVLSFFLLFIIALYFLKLNYLNSMVFLYAQMFEVLTGTESLNVSANARIFQSLIAFDYLDDNMISFFLGAGRVSNQWDGGFYSIFGYFFPSDIGLLGGVFLYGLCGFVFLCLVPFIISVSVIKSVRSDNNIFIMTMKYVLIFSLVRTLQGSFYFEAVNYVIPLCILLAFNKQGEVNAA